MPQFSKATLLLICTSLTPATAAFADAETEALLQEVFETMYAAAGTIEVGSKNDESRLTRWNQVIVTAPDSAVEVTIPWVEVSKKLLGGFVFTLAPNIAFSGDLPDLDGNLKGLFSHKDFKIEIDGAENDRDYIASFASFNFDMNAGDMITVIAQAGEGKSESKIANEVMSGAFQYSNIDVSYELNIEGEAAKTSLKFPELVGTYRSPVLAGNDFSEIQELWSADQNYFADYVAKSMTMETQLQAPTGPVAIAASGGETKGRLSSNEGTVTSFGAAKDIVYNVTVAGLPPMKVSMDEITTSTGIPLDNIDAAKPASIQMKLDGLDLDPNIWAMFDPMGKLTKGKANLEIDLSADVKWLQKLQDMTDAPAVGQMPLVVENAKITALNLNALGAELKTDGSFDINSKVFPPTANGSANVSLKGANELLTQLTEAGLLPQQNAMMAKGMMGIFFKQGGEGSDHLTSQIMVAPDGSVTANGFPLK